MGSTSAEVTHRSADVSAPVAREMASRLTVVIGG